MGDPISGMANHAGAHDVRTFTGDAGVSSFRSYRALQGFEIAQPVLQRQGQPSRRDQFLHNAHCGAGLIALDQQ